MFPVDIRMDTDWCCNFPSDIIIATGPLEKDTGTSDTATLLSTHVHLFLINKTVTFFKLASTFSAFLHPPTRGQPKNTGVIFWGHLCWLQKCVFVGMNYMLSCFTLSNGFYFSWYVGRKGQRKVNRRGQSGIDPPLMTSHLRALAWKLIRPAEGITWCEKIENGEKKILCLSTRHAMVGHRWTNVGLMFT